MIDQWIEIFKFRDLLNQAFQLPPLLRETTSVPVPLAASSPVVACGFLHSMKFLAPTDPIVSHELKAAKSIKKTSIKQIHNSERVNFKQNSHKIARRIIKIRNYHQIRPVGNKERKFWYLLREPEVSLREHRTWEQYQ